MTVKGRESELILPEILLPTSGSASPPFEIGNLISFLAYDVLRSRGLAPISLACTSLPVDVDRLDGWRDVDH